MMTVAVDFRQRFTGCGGEGLLERASSLETTRVDYWCVAAYIIRSKRAGGGGGGATTARSGRAGHSVEALEECPETTRLAPSPRK